MINPVQSITEYNGDDFDMYLETLQLIDIFEDLIKQYKHDKPLLKQITKYIVWTYSRESERVIIGMDWFENKRKIFEHIMLPNSVWEDVLELQSIVIVDTIERWFKHQNEPVYAQMVKLKELRLQMQRSFFLPISEVGYNQKFENAVHDQKLAIMIKDLQNELIQNDNRLSKAAAEVKNVKKKNTLGAEKYAR